MDWSNSKIKKTEKWVGEFEEGTPENIQSEQPRNDKLKNADSETCGQ